MAVSTLRVSDLLTRGTEKILHVSSGKAVPGSVPVAPLSSEGVSREQSQNRSLSDLSVQNSRSSSPDGRRAAQLDAFSAFKEFTIASGVSYEEGSADILSDASVNSEKPTSSSAPAKVVLESCPSFAEQNSVKSKPLWLERHHTLQRAYLSFIEAKGKQETRHESNDRTDDLTPYLPSWDIAKSHIWLLVETALLQTGLPPPAPKSPSSAGSLHSPAQQRRGSTTFAQPHGPLASVPEEDLSDNLLPGEPERSASVASSSSPSPPPFDRMVARARSMAKAMLPTPLGLGQTPLSRLASMSSAMRAMRMNGLFPSPSPGSAGAADSPAAESAGSSSADGAAQAGEGAGDEEKVAEVCPTRRKVAFAAGLAAATSASAAVASVAAAGLDVVASVAPGGASGLLALGSKALNAGANVMTDKVQNHISRQVTSMVAEVVMGEEACPNQREQLVARVQATLAGASIMWFLLNLHGMSDTLAHLDFEHDFTTSAKLVLDLVTSGPALMENCKDLLQVGLTVGLGMAQHNAAAAAGGADMGGPADSLARALSELSSSIYSDIGSGQ